MIPNHLIFICGALRSGSSLTHLMLDHHPNIKNPGEFDFLFDQVSDKGVFPEISGYHEWLSMHRIFQSKSLLIDRSLSYLELIASFVEQLSVNGSILALNVHRGFHRIPFLFSDAKYIHLVRDPRDVARSSIGMGWAGNVYYGVDHWVATENNWVLLESKIQPEKVLQVRFEDLIISPEQSLNRVCEFIGLVYSERMMDYTLQSSYSEPDTSLVNQWRRKLSVREVEYVELKASTLMGDLGYEVSGKAIKPLAVIEHSILGIGNKIFRYNFTLKRYGFFLVIKVKLSKLFGIHTIYNKGRLQMNELEKRFIK